MTSLGYDSRCHGFAATHKMKKMTNVKSFYLFLFDIFSYLSGLKVTKKFVITVSDRNDAPTSIKASGSLSIFENSAPGTYIGSVYTADQDVGQTHFYRIESVSAEGYKGKR